MGRISKCAGQALLDELVTNTVERLKNDRDAVSRTGCVCASFIERIFQGVDK